MYTVFLKELCFHITARPPTFKERLPIFEHIIKMIFWHGPLQDRASYPERDRPNPQWQFYKE